MDVYLFFVLVLFALAISDLIVGVSNDAVNFLNSAIGSKVASRNVIMIVASLGIIAGAVFSNGMMEVARKGIFHPQHYYFTEIMVVFLAVMLTDILLLDFFNTIGLPTSTTVSIVFELLGAAVAVALVKIATQPGALSLGEYINSGKALAIISGILLSVVVAFSVGMAVMWLSRLLFSFNFDKTIKYYGALWGGIAITSITYFILIKGAKGASFMTPDMKYYIKENTVVILLMSFAFWTMIMQLFSWIFKANILKIVVLAGTFALAMAFAGNDLVNFIGVPLAGLESFKLFQANGGNDFLMEGLAKKVETPTMFLLLASAIMVLTLWFSKKARRVTDTELNLARQDEGNERFGSSIFARLIVGRVLGSSTFFSTVLPESFIQKINKRFDQTAYNKKIQKQDNPPMFDLIRASVNLTVASILIAFATSLKLPLSTTYVTFMVAMGTSLADGAWGRDSAVYRITGVFTVIGGWFLTALVAFTVAFIIALFIGWAKLVAVVLLVSFAIYAIIRSNKTHKKREVENVVIEEEVADTVEKVLMKCSKSIHATLGETLSTFELMVDGLIREDLKRLKKLSKGADELNARVKEQKDSVHKVISKLQQDSIETGHYYVQIVDFQRELGHNLVYLIEPVLKHVDNRHKAILQVQADEIKELALNVSKLLSILMAIGKNNNYEKLDKAIEIQNELLESLDKYKKAQIKRIKNQEVGTRNSMLYTYLLAETRNMLNNSVNIVKAQRDFVTHTRK
ncbi:MAG: inorganic phosphate transporter [Salinivirgaceae bacterium]|jgi:phosphate/sulfate permease|nr:inorganic phosphate transporter [Salinivirgaceae bacterium]